jgi:hypothetical protein
MALEQRNPKIFKGELSECSVCGFGYVKSTMVSQRGKFVCTDTSIPEPGGTTVGCYDKPGFKELENNK